MFRCYSYTIIMERINSRLLKLQFSNFSKRELMRSLMMV